MVEKNILDYYEDIYKEYPNIPKSDIKRILLYGWKSLYLHNSYGGDVLLNQKGFWFYIGQLMNDSLKYFNYYKHKMRIKLRVLYKRLDIKWDGFYYFALTEKEFKEYQTLIHKKGRPRKHFIFNKVILYKIFDECNIINSNKIAIFKIPYMFDVGFSHYKDILKTDKAELILVRKPLTMHDILLSNYNYQFISDNIHKHLKHLKNE